MNGAGADRDGVYPATPKEGIPTIGPGELLRIDVTIIKLDVNSPDPARR